MPERLAKSRDSGFFTHRLSRIVQSDVRRHTKLNARATKKLSDSTTSDKQLVYWRPARHAQSYSSTPPSAQLITNKLLPRCQPESGSQLQRFSHRSHAVQNNDPIKDGTTARRRSRSNGVCVRDGRGPFWHDSLVRQSGHVENESLRQRLGGH